MIFPLLKTPEEQPDGLTNGQRWLQLLQ